MERIPELDGLRGLGAVMVVFYHWAPDYIFWSWSFVNMFFVLSGFLISRIVLEAVLAGRFSLGHFYMRRILRIWPVYYVSMAAIAAYLLLTRGMGFVDGPYFSDWLRSLVYLQFTPLYFENLWNFFDFLPGMLHIWTLAIEEQFYLVLPLVLLWLTPRLGLRKLGWLLVCIAVIAPVARSAGFAPTLILTQIDGLMIGVLLAVITTAHLRASGTAGGRWTALSYAACVAVALASLGPYLYQGYRYGHNPALLLLDPLIWTQADLFYFGIIGLIVIFPRNHFSAFLRSAPLVYLGSISYAMYLFHLPLLGFIEPRLTHSLGPTAGLVITAALIIGLPHLSRMLIERPALAWKGKFPTLRRRRNSTHDAKGREHPAKPT